MGLSGSGNPQLTALWQLDKAQAIRIVTQAIDDNDGNVMAAADALGVGCTTLKRWIKKHRELQLSVERIRREVAAAEAEGGRQ